MYVIKYIIYNIILYYIYVCVLLYFLTQLNITNGHVQTLKKNEELGPSGRGGPPSRSLEIRWDPSLV